jgi:phenylacetate-coenzyme A ligase PaaK-like adenylate-forming protein
MERVTGRTDDKTSSWRQRIPFAIETVLLQAEETAIRIVVDRTADHMDELDVLVKPRRRFTAIKAMVQLEKRLSYDAERSGSPARSTGWRGNHQAKVSGACGR